MLLCAAAMHACMLASACMHAPCHLLCGRSSLHTHHCLCMAPSQPGPSAHGCWHMAVCDSQQLAVTVLLAEPCLTHILLPTQLSPGIAHLAFVKASLTIA